MQFGGAPRFLIHTTGLPFEGPCDEAASGKFTPGKEVRFDRSETHHIRDVLRLAPGACIEVYSTVDRCAYAATLVDGDRDAAAARLEAVVPYPPPAPISLTLIVGVIKTQKCELIVEKAVELGAAAVVFFAADRSERSPDREKYEKRLARWQKIRDSAVKQSYTRRYPTLALESSLSAALAAAGSGSGDCLRLACLPPPLPQAPGVDAGSEAAPRPLQPTTIPQFFSSIADSRAAGRSALEKVHETVEIYLVIGPEGGFSRDELSLLARSEFRPLLLGENVLRTETAAIVACGLLAALAENGR